MGNGATMNYRFNSKNQWRRWAWNQAKRRLIEAKKKPGRATCLYLAGGKDLDRPIALRKGFLSSNLFAVENDKTTTRHLRRQKVNVIHGDFEKIINRWFPPPTLDVIIGDFCRGINVGKTRLWWALVTSYCLSSPKSVVIFNFLRGRDKPIGLANNIYDYLNSSTFDRKSNKHRGVQWYFDFCFRLLTELFCFHEACKHAEQAENSGLSPVDAAKYAYLRRHDGYLELQKVASLEDLAADFISVNRLLAPSFYSYRSTVGQYFDSVAFNLPAVAAIAGATEFKTIKAPFNVRSCDAAERRIAAAKAIRTMRTPC